MHVTDINVSAFLSSKELLLWLFQNSSFDFAKDNIIIKPVMSFFLEFNKQ